MDTTNRFGAPAAADDLASDCSLLADLLSPFGHSCTVVDGTLTATDANGVVCATGYDDVYDLSVALSSADLIDADNAFRAQYRDNQVAA